MATPDKMQQACRQTRVAAKGAKPASKERQSRRQSTLRPVNKSHGYRRKVQAGTSLQSQVPAQNLQVTRQGYHPR
jgi:hypothetical protein